MSSRLEDRGFMLKYLLNELSEDHRESVETRFMEDDDYYDKLKELEEDLIHDYLNGALSPDVEARLDEALNTSPALRRKLNEARALFHCLTELQDQVVVKPEAKPSFFHRLTQLLLRKYPVWVMAPIAALLVLALSLPVFFWLFLRTNQQSAQTATERALAELRSQTESEQVRLRDLQSRTESEQDRLRDLQGQADLEQTRLRDLQAQAARQARSGTNATEGPEQIATLFPRSTSPTVVISLSPSIDLSRPKELQLTPANNVIHIELTLGASANHPSYDLAVVRSDAPDRPMYSQNGLQQDGSGTFRYVEFEVNASDLTNGNYFIRLTATGAGGERTELPGYALRITRQ